MTNYEDDDIDDDVADNEPVDGDGGAAAPAGSRNFLLAAGIIGGVFILAVIGLVIFALTSRSQGSGGSAGEQANIDATNQVIMTQNAGTASAATLAAGLLLTPSVTPTPTNTLVPPTPTNTQVLAQATATSTSAAGSGSLITATPNLQTRTATVVALVTQNAAQTLTQAAARTGTAKAGLPKAGFAEDVGLPGLFGLALGLVLLIVLVRRLRLSTNG